jgi:hypothetical protein
MAHAFAIHSRFRFCSNLGVRFFLFLFITGRETSVCLKLYSLVPLMNLAKVYVIFVKPGRIIAQILLGVVHDAPPIF